MNKIQISGLLVSIVAVLGVAACSAHQPTIIPPTVAPTPDYEKLIRDNPGDSRLYLESANWYMYQGDYEQAVHSYTRYFEFNPVDPTLYLVYRDRGHAYSQLHEYEKAINDFDRVIELKPDLKLDYEYGVAYAGLDQASQAIERFTAIIKQPWQESLPVKSLEPPYTGVASAYCQRGFVYTKLGDNTNAIADLQECVKYCRRIPRFADMLQQAESLLAGLQKP